MMFIIGKGDRLAFTKLSFPLTDDKVIYSTPKHILTKHTSAHGVALPLSHDTLPLNTLLSGAFPKLPILVEEKRYRYLLITTKGNLSLIEVLLQEDKELKYNFHPIDATQTSWWLVSDENPIFSETPQMMMGFITSNPTEEQINIFYKKHYDFDEFNWINISDVVKAFIEP